MRVLSIVLCAILALSAAPPLAAAEAAFGPEQTGRVVDGVIAHVQKVYVFPERRGPIVDAIRSDLAKGRFATQNPKELAERLTETLVAASNDKHLNVLFDPQRSASLNSPSKQDDESYFETEGRKWNQGYVRQEILPGNVRYVRIRMFFWEEKETAGVIDSAARFLAGGSTAIIDLRGNGGGHAVAVQRLISYLMPEKRVELMTFFDGQTGKSEVASSMSKLPSPRILGRPVYVLTDRGSISAAEEFAYHIQQFKLGILVGETTAGAANNNVFLPLPEGFIASISYGRPIHPVSKTNWEGVGVAPDKPAPSAAALDLALVEALNALTQSPDADIKAEATWELPAVKARLNPLRAVPEDLRPLAGTYGERVVRWTPGGLTLQRSGGPVLALLPLGGDLFAVEGLDIIRFRFNRQNADGIVLEAIYKDGRMQSAKRDGAPG